MDLIPIKDFSNYSLDKNTKQVYNTKYNRYLKPYLSQGYYDIKLCENRYLKRFRLHRLIYQAYYPDIDISNLYIDHIDTNKTNNNIENLRHCSKSENNCNVKVRKSNLSTGIKNISLTKKNYYQVIISKNKKRYCKYFKILEEAILWRDNKLIELHGDFAYTE